MKYTVIFICLFGLFFVSCKKESEIKGNLFVVTKGAGNYKFGAVNVSAVSKKKADDYLQTVRDRENSLKAELNSLKSSQFGKYLDYLAEIHKKSLEMSDLYEGATLYAEKKTVSDSEGNFRLKLTAGDYYLISAATRTIDDKNETYLWFVPITVTGEEQSIVLSNNNVKLISTQYLN